MTKQRITKRSGDDTTTSKQRQNDDQTTIVRRLNDILLFSSLLPLSCLGWSLRNAPGSPPSGVQIAGGPLRLNHDNPRPFHVTRNKTEAPAMDFSLFDKDGEEGTGAAKLRNQSLYQKFDPLVAAAQDADEDPTAAPAGGAAGYTEAEKDELVAQAVAQAEEEASIVQMETEELRKELEAEREQNSQLTAVMEEYSAEITKLMAAKVTSTFFPVNNRS